MVRLFTPYGEYLRNKFGVKVQKLSVNAGFPVLTATDR